MKDLFSPAFFRALLVFVSIILAAFAVLGILGMVQS